MTGDDLEDRIIAEVAKRGLLPNVSYFAFTATPKAKTLEMFGVKPSPDGSFAALQPLLHAPGHRGTLHPRRTGELHHLPHLLEPAQDRGGRPALRAQKATYLLQALSSICTTMPSTRRWRSWSITSPARSLARIGGKAKAMIVTRSRLHAVRFKLAVDRLSQRARPSLQGAWWPSPARCATAASTTPKPA